MIRFYIPAVVFSILGLALIIVAVATSSSVSMQTFWIEFGLGLAFLIGGGLGIATLSGYARGFADEAAKRR